MGPHQKDVRSYLERLWSDELGTNKLDDASDFFKLGGDSMNAVRMLVAALDHWDAQIDLERFLRDPTLGNLDRLLVEAITV
jgi:acyl carrier protein